MCLIVFQYKTHPDYPLVLVANRDERHDRPSLPIHFWKDAPDILAGRDLERLGGWLGISRSGRLAVLTNHPFTDWQTDLNSLSRGELVREFLFRSDSPAHYALTLKDTRKHYDGYRLLFGDLDHLYLYSNVPGTCEHFPAGLHSVSNTEDDVSYHRRERGEMLVQDYLDHHSTLQPEELIRLFQDTAPTPVLSTFPKGVPVEEAKRFSSIFVAGGEFGTVATTVILVDKQGHVNVTEQRYGKEGPLELTKQSFRLEK